MLTKLILTAVIALAHLTSFADPVIVSPEALSVPQNIAILAEIARQVKSTI